MIRNTTVQKKKKIRNTFNEHFDRPTIVYSIVDTVYTVLAGISSVIPEAAC